MSSSVDVDDFDATVPWESKVYWFQEDELISSGIVFRNFCHYVGVVKQGLPDPAVVL